MRRSPWPGSAPIASASAVPGLVFWRLLGTGRRDDTGPGVDPRRTAMFAVWDDEPALDEFLGHSTIGRRWSDIDEAWHVRLRGLGGHGSWRGVDPLEGLEVGVGDGPIAVVTRADVRPGAWRSSAAPVVSSTTNSIAPTG